MKLLQTPLSDLGAALQFSNSWVGPAPGDGVEYKDWRMEDHDAPILQYLYKNLQPKRHLEFGTWYGFGACLVAEISPATIWTINLWEGERTPAGHNLYGSVDTPSAPLTQAPCQPAGLGARLKQMLTKFLLSTDTIQKPPLSLKASDSGELIGQMYRERGYGHRVNQVFTDSTKWDASNYPDHFFDTVMVDGGHGHQIVTNDTRKSLRLLRPGGLMIWHDYCPVPEIVSNVPTSKGVVEAIKGMSSELAAHFDALHWIIPSYVLVGMKRGN